MMRKLIYLRSDRQGNTLIETIAAITILSVALLPMLQTVVQSPWVLRQLKENSQAQRLVQEKMESMAGEGTPLKAGNYTENLGTFVREMSASEIAASGARRLLKVTVRIKKKDGTELFQAQNYVLSGGGTNGL